MILFSTRYINAYIKTLLLSISLILCGTDVYVLSDSPAQEQVITDTQAREALLAAQAEQIVAQPEKNELLEYITAQNLQSLPRIADKSLGNLLGDPYVFFNYLTESISNPQLYDKRKRAFKIIASAEQAKNDAWMRQSVLDSTTTHDLNLLCGSPDNLDTYLASILSKDRTHTQLGKAYLAGLVARPTTDVQLLEQRQQVIRTLVENKALFNQLDALLKEIAVHESLFTGLWDTELLMQFIDSSYVKMDVIGPMINKNSLCLEAKSLLSMGAICMATGIMAVSPVVLTAHGLSMLFRDKPMFESITSYCFGQTGMLFKLFPALENRWSQGAIALCLATVAALSLKPMLQGTHTVFLNDNFLRQRLAHIALYEEAAKNILNIMRQYAPELGSSCTFFSSIERFFSDEMAHNADLAQLDELLHTATFEKGTEDTYRLFFSRGNVLSAYYLLSTIKEKFETTMAGIGELDALLTAAKLIKTVPSEEVSWCFPLYVQDVKNPLVQLTDVWSPFIDTQAVVVNSIDLGVLYNVPNAVVTGPNSAGKSTILKSIALAIVLAQSLGIAPAQAMVLTPFSYLASYMNVVDSLVDQESKFQSEARRIFEYGDRLETLSKNNQFSFALFDEIFSGTSPKEGADLGYKVAAVLGNFPNSISVVASHFEKLTHLEADTAGRFVNYNVAVGQNSDGSIQCDANSKIQRLFTLERGISQQHIAYEVFKEKGMINQSAFFEKCFTR